MSLSIRSAAMLRSSFPVLRRGIALSTRSSSSSSYASRIRHAERRYSSDAVQERGDMKRCPFCGSTAPLSAHLCASCLAPSPIPDSVSLYAHFPEFQAPPDGPFELDVRKLRRAFLGIQQKIHPDRFSHDEKKRLVAESTSALLNKAYTTLQQPLARAEYILSLHGHELAGESESLTDADVLMTVMEAQEEIEAAETQADLQKVKADADALIQEELQNLSSLFAASQWQQAKQSAVKLRYWLNIKQSAADWESPASRVRLDH